MNFKSSKTCNLSDAHCVSSVWTSIDTSLFFLDCLSNTYTAYANHVQCAHKKKIYHCDALMLAWTFALRAQPMAKKALPTNNNSTTSLPPLFFTIVFWIILCLCSASCIFPGRCFQDHERKDARIDAFWWHKTTSVLSEDHVALHRVLWHTSPAFSLLLQICDVQAAA